mmetsp:Transcript_8422/g.38308  ORF Transcript_8422/g.38308 Transcript_8422/m.38308 type:complete len:351 (+) Transcript_8422:3043-4095(+)
MRITKRRDVEHGENAVIHLGPPLRRIDRPGMLRARFHRRLRFGYRPPRDVRAREPTRPIGQRLTLHLHDQPLLRVLHELLNQPAGSTRDELRGGCLVPRGSGVCLKKELHVVVYHLMQRRDLRWGEVAPRDARRERTRRRSIDTLRRFGRVVRPGRPRRGSDSLLRGSPFALRRLPRRPSPRERVDGTLAVLRPLRFRPIDVLCLAALRLASRGGRQRRQRESSFDPRGFWIDHGVVLVVFVIFLVPGESRGGASLVVRPRARVLLLGNLKVERYRRQKVGPLLLVVVLSVLPERVLVRQRQHSLDEVKVDVHQRQVRASSLRRSRVFALVVARQAPEEATLLSNDERVG